MSEIVKNEENIEIKKAEEEPQKIVLTPELCSWNDDDKFEYIFEIYLPGVEKETVKVRLGEDTLFVTGESDTVRYVGAYTLCCPVEGEKAKITYKNGLLRIHAPYKDYEVHTVEVPIE